MFGYILCFVGGVFTLMLGIATGVGVFVYCQDKLRGKHAPMKRPVRREGWNGYDG